MKGLLQPCWDFAVGDFFHSPSMMLPQTVLKSHCYLISSLMVLRLELELPLLPGPSPAHVFRRYVTGSWGCSLTPAGLPRGWRAGSLPHASSSAHI